MKDIIVDGHCDSLNEAYKQKKNLDDINLMFNIKMVKKPYLQFLATFINDEILKDNINNGYRYGNNVINYFYNQYNILKEKYNLEIIKSKNDLENIDKETLGILLSTENGGIIGNDKENILRLYKKGIRVMGITWNNDNLLGCGALTKKDTGLTDFGKECIKVMNELGIIVDVSHTSYNTFYDIVNMSNKVIATHSNVYNIKNHPRNLRDNQICEIAKLDGIIGICLCKDFLGDNNVTIYDIVKHIDYIVNLVGINHVAIGTDFDGVEKEDLPTGINNVKDIYKIKDALKENSYDDESIYKIMGGNYIRYLKDNI